MSELEAKYQTLREHVRALGRVAVAFSGGVDSSLLLAVAHQELGDDCLAVTASIHALPKRDLDEAQAFCEARGIRQIVVEVDELAIPGVAENPPDRCYLCKRGLFERMIAVCAEQGFAVLAEGSNTDDRGDYRPGRRAVEELGVASPLLAAGLSKAEIRSLSKQLELPSWDKPSAACLASRIAYGELITSEKLQMVEAAEALLRDRGFRDVRVRMHGDLARIELAPADIPTLAEPGLRAQIAQQLKELGFSYVALDLVGYRTGSMNESL